MPKLAKPPLPARYRLAVASRLLAATLGGYTLTALLVSCLARALDLVRAEAMLTATLPSFLLLTAAVLWAFAARNAWRAWLGLVVPSLLLAGYWLWLRGAGA